MKECRQRLFPVLFLTLFCCSGFPTAINAEGTFEIMLNGATVAHDSFPLLLEDVSGIVRTGSDFTAFDNLSFRIGRSCFLADGTFHKSEKRVNVCVSSSNLEPVDFIPLIPVFSALQPAGTVHVELRISGELAAPRIEARIEAVKLFLKIKERWGLELGETGFFVVSEGAVYSLKEAGFRIGDAVVKLRATLEPGTKGTVEKGIFSFKTRGLKLEELFAGHEKLKGAVCGNADIEFKIAGRAGDISSFEGSGFIHVRNGRLVKLTALKKLADRLNSSKLETVDVSYIGGTFQIAGGIVSFDELRVNSEILNADIDVKYALADDRLSGQARVTVNTGKLASEKGIGRLFKNVGPKVSMRLKIGGTFDKPEFEIDV